MSDKCGNCDCADKTQCVKKGSSFTVDIVSYGQTEVMEAPMAENNGDKCGCGPSCACVDCTCGH